MSRLAAAITLMAIFARPAYQAYVTYLARQEEESWLYPPRCQRRRPTFTERIRGEC